MTFQAQGILFDLDGTLIDHFHVLYRCYKHTLGQMGLPIPDFLDGTSLVPILQNPKIPGHVAVSYSRGTQTIRTDTHRLITHNNGHLELYDHRTQRAKRVIWRSPTLLR